MSLENWNYNLVVKFAFGLFQGKFKFDDEVKLFSLIYFLSNLDCKDHFIYFSFLFVKF